MTVANHESRTLTLADGRSVGFAEYGDPSGHPVLALHGAPACRLMFSIAHDAARAAGLRLCAPDRPGYGLTRPDGNPTLASRTDWHVAIADALGLDHFALLGISGGGPYATAVASRLGSRITALALVSPMGPIADYVGSPEAARAKIPFLQRRFFLHLPRRWFFPALARASVAFYMSSANRIARNVPVLIGDPDSHILDKPHIREMMVAMTREAFRNGSAGGSGDMRVYSQPWGLEFGRISAPAVLWQGTADRIVPVAAALHLAHSIPRCGLVRLEGAGHFWVFDHVEEVCGVLRDLIEMGQIVAEERSGRSSIA